MQAHYHSSVDLLPIITVDAVTCYYAPDGGRVTKDKASGKARIDYRRGQLAAYEAFIAQ